MPKVENYYCKRRLGCFSNLPEKLKLPFIPGWRRGGRLKMLISQETVPTVLEDGLCVVKLYVGLVFST